MKVSEIAVNDVVNYLKLDEYTEMEINTLLASSRSYIKSYTGLNELQIDEHEEFCTVIFVLCQDMYDNRSIYVEKNNVNKVVDSILGMHRTNLLPSTDMSSIDSSQKYYIENNQDGTVTFTKAVG